jgi:universal stress protein A
MKLKASSRRRLVADAAWEKIEILPFAPAGIGLNKLLVPIDFSDSSRKALQYAVSFAKRFKAEIILVHAVEMVPTGLPASPFATDTMTEVAVLQDHGARHVALWLKAAKEHVPTTAKIDSGNPAEIILHAACESNADLIIIGTHGHRGLERFFMGGTARKVVRHAPCPVLVVREHEHDFLIKGARKSSHTRRSTRKHSRLRAV